VGVGVCWGTSVGVRVVRFSLTTVGRGIVSLGAGGGKVDWIWFSPGHKTWHPVKNRSTRIRRITEGLLAVITVICLLALIISWEFIMG
jgi:hypothetical protein